LVAKRPALWSFGWQRAKQAANEVTPVKIAGTILAESLAVEQE
jgi:hypothetical protein